MDLFVDESRNSFTMYPLTKLETRYNKESIDKIGNSFDPRIG